MYNCWNEAYFYLKNKYGFKRNGLSSKSHEKLRRSRSKKEYNEILKGFTKDEHYNIVLNPIDKSNYTDLKIETLMSQYYCGISAKKELYNLLVQEGIIKNK